MCRNCQPRVHEVSAQSTMESVSVERNKFTLHTHCLYKAIPLACASPAKMLAHGRLLCDTVVQDVCAMAARIFFSVSRRSLLLPVAKTITSALKHTQRLSKASGIPWPAQGTDRCGLYCLAKASDAWPRHCAPYTLSLPAQGQRLGSHQATPCLHAQSKTCWRAACNMCDSAVPDAW